MSFALDRLLRVCWLRSLRVVRLGSVILTGVSAELGVLPLVWPVLLIQLQQHASFKATGCQFPALIDVVADHLGYEGFVVLEVFLMNFAILAFHRSFHCLAKHASARARVDHHRI